MEQPHVTNDYELAHDKTYKLVSAPRKDQPAGFKFNFFDSLLKLASGIIFHLLNLSAYLLFHTCKHC